MASNRHLGRIVALQTLYEVDFRFEVQDKHMDVAVVLQRNIDRYSEVLEDKEFIHQVVKGVVDKVDEMDNIIQPIAPDWPIAQIARIDRTVLRMGVYELKYVQSVPSKVIINEAVELAKAFGSENSSKFVNGVLGTAYKQFTSEQEKTSKDANKPPKKKSK